MIHSKNNAGFTLIEAMIAMVIVAIVFTPLFIMQASVVQNLFRATQRMRRVLYVDTFLAQARQKLEPGTTEIVFEQKIDDPLTYFKYEMKPIEKQSALSTVPRLRIERVTARWQEDTKKEQEMLVTFTFIGPEYAPA